MARQIKFRGLRTDGKGWVYGFLIEEYDIRVFIEDKSVGFSTYDDYEVIPESVGQFTGLKDKNGVEVYEGDVITHEDYSKGACLTFKQFERKSTVVCDNLFDGIKLYGLGYQPYSDKNKSSFEIIGNIHESEVTNG